MSAPRPSSPKAWIMAARPQTLPVSIGPVLVGTAVAFVEGHVRVGPALAAGAGALCLQIGSNLANDVFDFEKGADTADRVGPPRAAQMGLLTPTELKRGMFGVFAVAMLIGVYLSVVAGPIIVLIGLVSILAAIAYTGGPWPLGYHGLGDLAVFVFFGLIAVVGTTFVQVGATSTLAWLAAIPVGFMATAILVVNNLRDVETDRVAGKRTLAVRLGRGGARAEWFGLVGGAYLLTAVPIVLFEMPFSLLLPWLSAPLAFSLWRVIRSTTTGPELNETLVGTARLGALFSMLFAIGLCGSRWS